MSIAEPQPAPVSDLRVISDATCTFCGCVCDDMELTVENNHITKAKNACVLGKAWFLNHHIEDRPVATVRGQPVPLEAAIEEAARILAGARYPIVYGLSDTTCEAQRVAVGIAARIGGCVGTTTPGCTGAPGPRRCVTGRGDCLFRGGGRSPARGAGSRTGPTW